MEHILYIGIIETFLVGLFVLIRRPVVLANRILVAWMFIICIEMIIVLINDNVVDFYSIKIISMSYGPLLFLYCKYLTKEEPKFRLLHLMHLIPPTIFFFILLAYINEPVMDGTTGFFETDGYFSLRLLYGICLFISITAYSIATFVMISRHQKKIGYYLSYRSNKVTLSWLIVLSVTFYLTYLITFIFGGIDIITGFMDFDPYELSFGGLTIFAFLFGFFGYDQQLIYDKIVLSQNIEIPAKYVRSGLKEKDANLYSRKIFDYMVTEKPFLNREMTILDMSIALNISRHHLTEVLNEYIGKNFYSFVNEYRVEEVKSMMKDRRNDNYSILAIAYDAGFNSKSAFNTIFKNITGQTPSQFRSLIIANREVS